MLFHKQQKVKEMKFQFFAHFSFFFFGLTIVSNLSYGSNNNEFNLNGQMFNWPFVPDHAETSIQSLNLIFI